MMWSTTRRQSRLSSRACERQLSCRHRGLSRRGDGAELFQHPEQFIAPPRLDNLAAGQAIRRRAGERHLLAGGRDARELQLVSAPRGPALYDLDALRDQIIDHNVAIGKSRK